MNLSFLRLLVPLALLGTVLGVASPASAVAPSAPPFPRSIDAYSRYEAESGCDPTPKPGAEALVRLLKATYGTSITSNISRACTASNSGHEEGRAIDWMTNSRVPDQRATAESFLEWLLRDDEYGNHHAMARRLGIQYVIWDSRIFSLYNTAAGWREYSDCVSVRTSPVDDNICHRNHVHISMSWAGARGETSWYTLQYSAWQSLGGGIIGRPAALSTPSDGMEVVTVGTDRALYSRSFSGSWSPWEGLGGTTDLSPAVASPAKDRVDVFVRGTDNALWHRTRTGKTWSAWESLGGTLDSAPAAVSAKPGGMDVFVRGTDKALWQRSYSGGSWSGWKSLGGGLASAPSVTSDGPGRIDLVVTGTDGGVWHRSLRTTWTPWLNLGGQSTSDPAIAAPATNMLEVASVGKDRRVKRRGYSAGWLGWSDAGGQTDAGPALVGRLDKKMAVFVRGTDGAVWVSTTQAR
ncbi:MAG: hypothetical protein ACLGIA_06170 [Actinomycetes bacterium]